MNLTEVKNQLNKIKRTKFGIAVPELRKFAKSIARDNYKEFIKNNDYLKYMVDVIHPNSTTGVTLYSKAIFEGSKPKAS